MERGCPHGSLSSRKRIHAGYFRKVRSLAGSAPQWTGSGPARL